MPFEPSAKVQDLQRRVAAFMDEHIYPNERRHAHEAETLGPWKVHPVVEELKPKARAAGWWNLFLPESSHGAALSNQSSWARLTQTTRTGTCSSR